MAACTCVEGEACSHVQTFRSKNRVESSPTQLDYAFVSESVVSTLSDCRVVQDAAVWELSDHCPILLELNVVESQCQRSLAQSRNSSQKSSGDSRRRWRN